jgi:hypothetical protein
MEIASINVAYDKEKMYQAMFEKGCYRYFQNVVLKKGSWDWLRNVVTIFETIYVKHLIENIPEILTSNGGVSNDRSVYFVFYKNKKKKFRMALAQLLPGLSQFSSTPD